MGARCTFVLKHSDDQAVALYSHWGEDSMNRDIAGALAHCEPRWNDPSYGTRMFISYMIQYDLMSETGFGIYPCNPSDLGFIDHPIIIDFTNGTVGIGSEWHSFEEWISFYRSKELFGS
jgi:hypothetical protein